MAEGKTGTDKPSPLISVIIVNYNGQRWMERCLDSLKEQTLFPTMQIIVADNNSTDGSDRLSREWLARHAAGQGRFLANQTNLGFCQANNLAADQAQGQYLFFLNGDTWLEPSCLERLSTEVQRQAVDAAAPLVMEYDSDQFQSSGAPGLDLFGLSNSMTRPPKAGEIFAAPGCSLFVRGALFRAVGGFPEEFFMYGEETDLCWRIWLAGGRIVVVPTARLHHRGAASANPQGGTTMTESRTNETKRYLSNRNSVLVLLRNAQNLLLLLLIPHLLLLAAEALVTGLSVRRWNYLRKCYLQAVTDCWRMRHQVRAERTRIRRFRQRSDFWMMRFLHWRPSRWPEIQRLFRFGFPQVDPR